MPEIHTNGSAKQYNIGYRRVIYLCRDRSDQTLEQNIREFFDRRKSVLERTITITDDFCLQARSVRKKIRGVLVHIVAYSPGSATNVIPHNTGSAAAPILLTQAPPESDFMDGNIAAYVVGNHVVFCGKSIRESRIALYCHRGFKEAGMDDETSQFELRKIADVAKLRVLEEEGVKSIQLDADVYAATLSHLQRTSRQGRGNWLRNLVGAFDSDSLVAAADNESLHATLNLRFNSRKGGQLSQEILMAISKGEVEDDMSGFAIETKKGNRITHDEVLIRKTVRLSQIGKSFDYEEAWKVLERFYGELLEEGVLEQ